MGTKKEDYTYYGFLVGTAYKDIYISKVDVEEYKRVYGDNILTKNMNYVFENMIMESIKEKQIDAGIKSFDFKYSKDNIELAIGKDTILTITLINDIGDDKKTKIESVVKEIIGDITIDFTVSSSGAPASGGAPATKICSICKLSKVKDNYSKAQWKKDEPKCKDCLDELTMKHGAEILATKLKKEEEKEKEKDVEKKEKIKRQQQKKERVETQRLDAKRKEVEQEARIIQYKKSMEDIDQLLRVIDSLRYVNNRRTNYFYQKDEAETIFKDITKLLNENKFGKLVMVGNYSIYKLMEKERIDIIGKPIETSDIDGKLCISSSMKEEDISKIRKDVINLLKENSFVVETNAIETTQDPVVPIKIISSKGNAIIDITFAPYITDEDYNDIRCKTEININGMWISDSESTLSHYLDIFASLKKDDGTYDMRMIKEISDDTIIEIEEERNGKRTKKKYNYPLWQALIQKAKHTDEYSDIKGLSINKDYFPSFLSRENIKRVEQKTFMTKVASFGYKLYSWKGSLERLKQVFEKRIKDGTISLGRGGAKGGKRTIRKKHKKKKTTRRKSTKNRRRNTFKKRNSRRKTINNRIQ